MVEARFLSVGMEVTDKEEKETRKIYMVMD